MPPERAARILAALGGFLLLLVLGLRAVSMAFTNQEVRASQPEQARYPIVAGVGRYSYSPDGSQVIFAQQTDLQGNIGWFRMTLKDGAIQPTDQPQADIRPFLLRDNQLFLLTGNGAALTTGSPRGTFVATYALARDGKKMAFSTYRVNGKNELYVLHSTGQLAWFGEFDSLTELAWSPDGKQIIFVSNAEGNEQIFQINSDGMALKQVTHSPGHKSSPTWSPDGKSIAFLVTPEQAKSDSEIATPTPNGLVQPIERTIDNVVPGDIYLIDASGAKQVRLTKEVQPYENLGWIENGSKLVYTLRAVDQPQATYLYAIDPKNGKISRIYPPLEITALECPAYTARGKAATVNVTIRNTSLGNIDTPILVRVGPKPFAVTGPRNTGNLSIKTLPVPANKTTNANWNITTTPRLFTYVSGLINIGETIPMSEMHCRIVNTTFGLPNVAFLNIIVLLTIPGMALIVPWLRHQKSRWLWAAWLFFPVLIGLFILVETKIIS